MNKRIFFQLLTGVVPEPFPIRFFNNSRHENFLQTRPKLAGVVRRDRRVADAIRHQTGLLSRFPNSPAATDVVAVAQSLLKPA